MAQTLFDKLWKNHVVSAELDQPELLYIDLHLVHEVTSPQAFDGLRLNKRKFRRPDLTFAVLDHAIPTINRNLPFRDSLAAKQVETLRRNCAEFGVKLFDLNSREQGIVHVFAPELGLTQPGMTIVCGDSHTATHGAFGSLAFGIGTSEVEHVFATQCLSQKKPKNLRIQVNGKLPFGVTAKDLILGIIGIIGTDGANNHVIEYAGEAIKSLSMEERMTICNMSVEAGARAGMIAPDEITFEYLKDKPFAPKNKAWDKAAEFWQTLSTDENASFDRTIEIQAGELEPLVTWGTSPGMVAPISGSVPELFSAVSETERQSFERALKYMALEPRQKIESIKIDRVFIGSCTNSRIEDLRAAAEIVRGYQVNENVRAMIVPGSMQVKKQAEVEGLAKIFANAGFEWRDAGCSMCVGINEDILQPGERCASTSNRNFEGRQGRGGRTHLVSPAMAAAAGVTGHFVDVRNWKFKK